jgi:hypothetical protein
MSEKRVRLTQRDALAVLVAVEGNRKLARPSPDWMVKAAEQVEKTGEDGVTLVVHDGTVEAVYEPRVTRDSLGRPLHGR